MKKKARYYVDFYDVFDGWGGVFGFYPDRLFDDLDKAQAKADELQETLNSGNVEMGEHYGVIDGTIGKEIYCTRQEKETKELKQIKVAVVIVGKKPVIS